MATRRVLVCDTQIPFIEGGAELHVRALVHQLNRRGYEAELIAVPFNPQAKSQLLSQAEAWRLLNCREAGGRPVDALIATRFPSYCAKHGNKIAWIIHQHRAAYELAGTPYSDFRHTPSDVAIRRQLIEIDTKMLKECRRVFANAGNTAARLGKFNGIAATPLYHPPPLAERLRRGASGNYVLSVGRLEAIKRPELAIEAFASVPPPLELVIVGDGSYRPVAEAAAITAGVADRVRFVGRTSIEDLIELYAGALAVFYAPYDEDYGYVTLEAFLAGKPVITALDAGGPLEFVVDGINGFVCEPTAAAFATAIRALDTDRDRARAFGDAGYARAREITWDGVIEALLGAAA